MSLKVNFFICIHTLERSSSLHFPFSNSKLNNACQLTSFTSFSLQNLVDFFSDDKPDNKFCFR